MTGNDPQGTLFIVSTPIGNLEDITFRAVETLRRVNIIAAEGVQHSKRLLGHYGVKTKLTSYNQHNHKTKGPDLIERLKSGQDVAYISNAGTPAVSDPGTDLIRQASRLNIQVSPIPGPSALTAALSVSGMGRDGFLFLGFLSNRTGRRKKELRELALERRTMVFFESPHRLLDMLNDLKDTLGDREIVLLKELTKIYEAVKRGTVSAIIREQSEVKIRGEFTLVVAGRPKSEENTPLDEGVLESIKGLMREGQLSVRDMARKIALEKNLKYRAVYKQCLSLKRQMEP